MPEVWEILLQDHSEQIPLLAGYQWEHFKTKLDFLLLLDKETPLVTAIFTKYPTLSEIDKTIREKPKQERGKGW